MNLSVNFMRPAPLGRFTCFAEIERCGLTVVFARARLVDASTRLVASGASTLSILDLPNAAPVATVMEATA
jgi:acyl-coenzyme A thioesterase PaaI-like protein